MFIRKKIPSQLGQTRQGLLVLTLQMILHSFYDLHIISLYLFESHFTFLDCRWREKLLLSTMSHTNSDFCYKSEHSAYLGLALLLLSTFVLLTGSSFPFSKTSLMWSRSKGTTMRGLELLLKSFTGSLTWFSCQEIGVLFTWRTSWVIIEQNQNTKKAMELF